METQTLPDFCGFEISKWWCPLTDLTIYFIIIGMALLLTGIIYLIYLISKKLDGLNTQPKSS